MIGADLFCGAGGFTTGAEASGHVKIALAVNHWQPAIFTHRTNHPGTRHICARIDDVDPRHDTTLPELDLLLASPECTHHSIARGGRPIDDQKRATPWHVIIWAEAKRPQWVVVENVREFRDWGPIDEHGRPIKSRKGEIFRQWIKSLEAVGYQVDHQLLNAADFGAATKRVRLFIVARRGNSKRDIPWPEITHPQAQWKPAWSVIDWSKPCPSIFARKRPLAEKTIRRIEIGLRKFVGAAAEPFIVKLRNNCNADSLHGPLSTITTSGAHHGLAMPFMLPRQGFYDCRKDKPAKGIDEPIPTITASHVPAGVVMPFITQYHNGDGGEQRNYSPAEPLRTLDTQNRYGIVVPFQFKAMGRNPGATKSIDTPIPTIVAARENHAIVVPYLLAVNHGGEDDRSHSPQEPLATLTTKTGHSIVLPFLTKYYGTGSVQAVTEPVDTITTKDRFGLAMVSLIKTMQELGVVDIGFRMLDVDELARAQGFPEGYVLHGTKAEQVKQVGNSVSPPVAEALCRTLGEQAA
jgi:DNA (cytosine-5)-methyltransferase 1